LSLPVLAGNPLGNLARNGISARNSVLAGNSPRNLAGNGISAGNPLGNSVLARRYIFIRYYVTYYITV